jgi:predicted secreted protein
VGKYTGKAMRIFFGTLDISGQGRNLEISQQADDIDVTSYGSTDKEFITGFTDRSGTLEVLDDDSATAVRTALTPGSANSLTWYPQGTTSGKPKRSVGTAIITEANEQYPYDDAVLLNVTMRINGKPTEGTAA